MAQEDLSPSDDGLQLLYCALALKLGFASGQAMERALEDRQAGCRDPLDQLLRKQAKLETTTDALIRTLVDQLARRHAGDALAALKALESSRDELARDILLSSFFLKPTEPPSTVRPKPGDEPTVSEPADPEAETREAHHHEKTAAAHSDPHHRPPVRPEEPLGHRFKVLDLLARGAFGEVYVARDTELDREVAVKRIRTAISTRRQYREMFVYEARITGGLDHPSIVPVFSLGHDDEGRPYYTMRLIRGRSLRQQIQRLHDPKRADLTDADRRLEQFDLLRRFVAVCYAVEYAHTRGVIHRDIKPSNIMLGHFGETFVVDWGLAKTLGHSAAHDDSGEIPLIVSSGSDEVSLPGVKGTLQYMSPQQARAETPVVADDVFSLGATLYHILTGRTPYNQNPQTHEQELKDAVRAGQFPKPTAVNDRIPRALDAVCLKAMGIRREDRYPSARELASDVERWLSDEPVLTYREPWPTRAWRWARKHPTRVGIAATMLAMLATASVPLTVLYQQKSAALVQSQIAELDATKAKTKAIEALDRELMAKKRTGESYLHTIALASAAVRSAEAIANQPGVEPARRLLAEQSAMAYDAFLIKLHHDEQLVRQAVLGYRVAGNLGRQLQNDQSAIQAHYDKALKHSKELSERDRDPRDARMVARVLVDRAQWHTDHGRCRDAEADLRDAEQFLPPPNPNAADMENRANLQVQAMIATTRADIGELQGRSEDALKHAQQSAKTLGDLSNMPNPELVNMTMCYEASLKVARIARALGENDTAQQALFAAEGMFKKLEGGKSWEMDSVARRAGLGLTRVSDGRSDDRLNSAISALESLYEQHPLIPEYRRNLADALVERGALKLDRDPSAALADANAALKLVSEGPNEFKSVHADFRTRARVHLLLARLARKNGETAKAEQFADEALKACLVAKQRAPDCVSIEKLINEIEAEHKGARVVPD